MKHKRGEGGLVYSTEVGRTCPNCRQPIDACTCPSQNATPAAGGTVRVLRERKGRAGKTVTVITGVPLDALPLAQLCQKLKTRCGAGGTTRGSDIEIQGDHVETAVKALAAEGFRVKRSGG
jgi:translation initiation factor 1